MGVKNMQKRTNRWGLVLSTALALAALMAVSLLAACSGGGKSSDSSSAESSIPASKSVSVKEVDLSPTTEYLEYSPKDIDPITLVSASDSEVSVVTDDKIDLMKVGAQVVRYKLSAGDDSDIREIQFTVRDTKAPEIELSNANPSIEQGEAFDPQSCISKVSDPVDGDLPKVDVEPESQGESAGLEQFYDDGWYVVDGVVDSNTPGTHNLTVKACDKHGNVETKELRVTVKEPKVDPETVKHTYIANEHTHKFHISGCQEIKKIKESNRREITATRQEMIDMEYEPCGRCNP